MNFRLSSAEARERWIKALRSGRYKQGKSVLCKVEDPAEPDEKPSFCCLGVACDLFSQLEEGLEASDQRTTLPGYFHKSGQNTTITARYYDEDSDWLPDRVRRWLGLKDCHGSFNMGWGPGTDNLGSLNDIGKSFADIADLIETNPTGLLESETASDLQAASS